MLNNFPFYEQLLDIFMDDLSMVEAYRTQLPKWAYNCFSKNLSRILCVVNRCRKLYPDFCVDYDADLPIPPDINAGSVASERSEDK